LRVLGPDQAGPGGRDVPSRLSRTGRVLVLVRLLTGTFLLGRTLGYVLTGSEESGTPLA